MTGYPPEYLRAIQLRPKYGSNIIAAEELIAPAIEDFLDEINTLIRTKKPSLARKTKVDLISHSMGALSARWYTAKVQPDRVRLWLSLAGANHGTNVLCKYQGLGADELCPAYAKHKKDSRIQFELNGLPKRADVDETPYGIGKDSPDVDSVSPNLDLRIIYLSIRTSPDEWIKPETSPILDGAGNLPFKMPQAVPAKETTPGNIIMTNKVGHDEMLTSAQTMYLIRYFLNASFSLY